ncbi:TonB-dependent receptor domain-containing protein [Albibacterium profundi]|uniref:TonB-dependent receptor n=1 Tax=Albibacterium profundi TaxID=3134906 RepID=A0ABV5CHG9_9SPHI
MKPFILKCGTILSAFLIVNSTYAQLSGPHPNVETERVESTDELQRPGSISGLILSENDEPLVGISLKLEEISLGITSDENGYYKLKDIPPGSYTITASGLGYAASKQNVIVRGGRNTELNLQLNKTAQSLNEVIITGSQNRFARKESDFVGKMPLLNIENPQVYNSIGKELLTEQLVYSVDDAMRNAPGIQKMWEATGRAGDGGAYYNTRGFITQGLLRNGIAGKVTSSIDAINIEKIEVIKGPSATLFGSSLTSYGGSINRVTKKPFENFSTEVTLAGGTNDFHRISADINTPVTADKSLLFRLNTAYNYEGTFQKIGYNKSFALAPSLTYKANDRLTVNLDVEFFSVNGTGKQMIFFYHPAVALGISSAEDMNLDYEKSYMGEGLTQKSENINFFGQVNYKISDYVTSSTNFTTTTNSSEGFGAYFYLVPDNLVTGNDADAGQANYLARADQSTIDSKDRSFEIQQLFTGDFHIGSMRNRVVLGLDYYVTNIDELFYGSEYDIVPLHNPNFDYSQFNGENQAAMYDNEDIDFTWPVNKQSKTYSAFVSDVLNLTDQLSVLAALRIDRFENAAGVEGVAYEGYDQNALSPKFGIVYQPILDKVSIFANYQNSFTNKGFYSAYDAESSQIVQEAADLEHANQVEGGVKLDLLNGKLTTSLSYYNILVENMLRADPNPDAAQLSAQIQDGSQRSKGFEVDLIASPLEGLNIVAGFSYNDSEYEKSDADVLGRRPTTASSPYLGNLWVSYRFPQHIAKGFGIGFGGNYASENKILNSVYYGEFSLPSYTVLNASAFYDFPKVRIGLKVDNITNEHYWIGYTTANPQSTRQMVASLSYKF